MIDQIQWTPPEALERASAAEDAEDLRKRAAADAADMVDQWPLVKPHGPFLSPEVHDDCSVAAWRMPPDGLVSGAAKAAAATTLASGETSWREKHFMVMHDNCQRLGKVPTLHNICNDAQRCVHIGQGRRSFHLYERLRHAFLSFGVVLKLCVNRPTKAWNKLLQSSTYVVRFQGAPADDKASFGSIGTPHIKVSVRCHRPDRIEIDLGCHRMGHHF